jgi:ABC-type multidrug transport system fused ATPase/permease subunit
MVLSRVGIVCSRTKFNVHPQYITSLRSHRHVSADRKYFQLYSTSLTGSKREEPKMLPSTQKLVDGILQGNRMSLSRGITLGMLKYAPRLIHILYFRSLMNILVESTLNRDEDQAEILLDSVLTSRRLARKKQQEFKGLPTFRVGIAGPPGAGKSTFIESLGLFLTERQHKVAVLAIGWCF